jgi:signal transduction histidine kinase
MNLSFTAKIRAIIVFLLLISFVQGMIIIRASMNLDDINSEKQDIQNTVFITWFFQFLLSMILIFYLPVFLKKAFSEIHQKLKDIAQGNYSIDIDLNNLKSTLDQEFLKVFISVNDMLKSISTFDSLKKDKIIEHHNRIKALLMLCKDGFLIVDKKGNIVYVNDVVTEIFPQLEEKVNIVDSNFPPDIENNIKKYVLTTLLQETKQEAIQFYYPVLKRHISLSNAIVRNNGGKAIGAVIAFYNLEKKKAEGSI